MGTPIIYSDMDGVLADFDGKVRQIANIKGKPEEVLGHDKVSELAKTTPNFFADLAVLPHALDLLKECVKIGGRYSILSSALKFDPEVSERGKTKWIAKHLTHNPPAAIIYEREKYKYAVQSDGTPNILIDDWDHNIKLWEAHGGIGIQYKPENYTQHIKQLKEAFRKASSMKVPAITQPMQESILRTHSKKLTSEQVINYAQSIHRNYKLIKPIKEYREWIMTEVKLSDLSTVEYGRIDDPYKRKIRINFEHVESIDPTFIRPIVIDSKGFILDGNHRATKARMEGHTKIMALKPILESKFNFKQADPNFALGCKKLAPMLQLKMLVTWPNNDTADENYNIQCVYCTNPKTGKVYWSNGVYESEESFLKQFPNGSTTNIGISDIQDEIADKKMKPYIKSKATAIEALARKMLGLKTNESKERIGQKLMEGGNVFKTEEGPLTQRINRADIKPTLVFLEKITGLPLLGNTLGSVGKKASSGDIDVGVDEKLTTKESLVQKLLGWVEKFHQGDKPRLWVAKSGDSVHFRTPIAGKENKGFVQTDFMFGADPDFQKFSLMSMGDASQFSGADRNILLASIAKGRGAKWSYKSGLVNRETGETISKDPTQIAQFLLNNKAAKPEQLYSVESILHAIKNDPQYQNLIADAKEAFAKGGKQI